MTGVGFARLSDRRGLKANALATSSGRTIHLRNMMTLHKREGRVDINSPAWAANRSSDRC